MADLPDGSTLVAFATDIGDGGTTQSLARVEANRTVTTVKLHTSQTFHGGADNHEQPQVWVDMRGFIWFLTGAHHGPLFITRSIEKGRIDAGFEPLRRAGVPAIRPQWGHTYPSVVMVGPTIHLIARKTGVKGRGYRFDLVHAFSDDDGWTWSEAKIADFEQDHAYGIYYHHARIGPGSIEVEVQPAYREPGRPGGAGTLTHLPARTLEIAFDGGDAGEASAQRKAAAVSFD